jgi:Ni2+-binding GTPase involved in maturation of urease and hydrogenase
LQIFGPESSGKTTLAMHAIAEVQKQGGVACFIDAEHAFDAVYAGVSCITALQLAAATVSVRDNRTACRAGCGYGCNSTQHGCSHCVHLPDELWIRPVLQMAFAGMLASSR